MITYTTGDIFTAGTEAIVNPVNCVGVMGKGLALQFKRRFPEPSKAYIKACKQGELQFGKVFSVEQDPLFKPRYIIHFPTKNHWRAKSKYEEVGVTLRALASELIELKVSSVAIPPIGCGNGGLDWSRVRRQIENELSRCDTEIIVFEPTQAFQHRDELKTSKHLKMTPIRASLLKLLDAYKVLDCACTRIEAQKLGYFLQESGQKMNLQFEKQQFGPYSQRLHKSFETMNGRFIEGYGGGDKAQIKVIAGAVALADRKLLECEDTSDTAEGLQKVKELIEGFETPHGLELLSTTHWLYTQEGVRTLPELWDGFASWNERKKEKFSEYEIDIASQHLRDEGWCPEFK